MSMKSSNAGALLIALIFIVVAAWLLGLNDLVRKAVESGRVVDWLLGAVALVWLAVILKAPWDLYFRAREVGFDQERASARGVAVGAERVRYVQRLRTRLAMAAVLAHLLSAGLVALVTWASEGSTGYYFAAFYLVSTAFRPALAGYAYLWRKLNIIRDEANFPPDDIQTCLLKVEEAQAKSEAVRLELLQLAERLQQTEQQLTAEAQARQAETRELRQGLTSMGREFEAAITRLTDNQELIRGIQAFVRLISQAARTP